MLMRGLATSRPSFLAVSGRRGQTLRRTMMTRVATTTNVPTTSTPTSDGAEATAASKKVTPQNFYLLTGEEKPAQRDAATFQCDPSVKWWQEWRDPYINAPDATAAFNAFRERLQKSGALDSAEGAAYWSYHCARILYFIATGAVGALSSNTTAGRTFVGQDTRATLRRFSLMVSESLAMFKQDFEAIRQGVYKAPWDFEMGLRHRQLSPGYIVDKTVRFMRESGLTLGRMQDQVPDKIWLSSELFPKYYKTFHFQTEGWLSSWSSRAYEFNTEVLFAGRQDAMQRLALVPLKGFMQGRRQEEVAVLELACGTGRFHTFLRDNYPLCPTTALDLSPFYLERARENVEYWASSRGAGLPLPPTQFVMGNAESTGLPSSSYDVITSTYLFHEIPPQARVNVAREVARLLKPGGMFIFCDSMQLGDRPEFDGTMHLFGKMNEPHYAGYIATDFGALFQAEGGLIPGEKFMGSRTKVLTFFKPSDRSDN